jgi:hypothetical protein
MNTYWKMTNQSGANIAMLCTMILASTLYALVIIIPSIPSAEATWRFFVVTYENKTYHIVHSPYSATITNITATNMQISITLQSDQDGEVQVAIPKELLNATRISYDDEGIVPGIFEDGRISEDYTTVPRENDIIFTIPFVTGTEEILIVGSDIPEFDGLLFAVLGVSMGVMIIAMSKFRSIKHLA